MQKDIFEYIKAEEAAYALPITVIDGYEWSMKEHIRLSILYKNSQFSTGNSKSQRDNKPFKNIVLPILRLQYRTEGFDVKDVLLYVDDSKNFFKSFLVRKYHDRWATENEIDTFIDEMVESHTDFGGALIKDENKKKPAVVPLQTIAFCDQTNLLGGPIGFLHNYSPDELLDFEKIGWGNPKNGADATILECIVMAQEFKTNDKQDGKQVKTPGKYIEVYEVHGTLPESYLKPDGNPDKFVNQMQIVAFYKDEQGKRQGITLFRGKKGKTSVTFKVILRDKIFNRALGLGGVEELFEPQIWTNYGEIIKKGMLDAASKIIYQTTDQSFKQRNKILNLENQEVLVMENGTTLSQVQNGTPNMALFERAVAEWQVNAQTIGSAQDAILGDNPASGTPFKLQDLVVTEAHGLHDYRRGKISTFFVSIYRDWVLPYITSDITKGKTFLAELSLDELQQVADAVVECQIEDIIKAKILAGEEIDPQDMENVKQKARENFMKQGNSRFLEIFDNEMKDVPLSVKVNIAGKQKDINKITDKLVNIFRQIIANPAVLDDPRMAKLFSQIIEYSGLSPIDFGFTIPKPQQQQQQVVQPNQKPAIPTPPADAAAGTY